MLCLKCKRISPQGSLYCSTCPGSLSFNCVVCSGGHRCPVGSVTCPTCGKGDFSQPVTGIPLRGISVLGSIVLLLLLGKLLFANGGLVGLWLWRSASFGFGFMTGSDSNALWYVMRSLIAWSILIWFFGAWMSLVHGSIGKVGTWVRNLPFVLAVRAIRSTPKLLSRCWQGITLLTGMSTRTHKSKDKGGSGS